MCAGCQGRRHTPKQGVSEPGACLRVPPPPLSASIACCMRRVTSSTRNSNPGTCARLPKPSRSDLRGKFVTAATRTHARLPAGRSTCEASSSMPLRGERCSAARTGSARAREPFFLVLFFLLSATARPLKAPRRTSLRDRVRLRGTPARGDQAPGGGEPPGERQTPRALRLVTRARK